MSGAGACRDNLDTWLDNLPDKEPTKEQPMSDTLQEREDEMFDIECQFCGFKGTFKQGAEHRKQTQHLLRTGTIAELRRSQRPEFCTECSGYTHMPWCPAYEPAVDDRELYKQPPTIEHEPTPAPNISSLLDQLQEQLSVVVKERDELRAERTRLREVVTIAAEQLDRASLVQDRSVNLVKHACRFVAKKLRAALSDQKGPSA